MLLNCRALKKFLNTSFVLKNVLFNNLELKSIVDDVVYNACVQKTNNFVIQNTMYQNIFQDRLK